jgi:hypothetical protein
MFLLIRSRFQFADPDTNTFYLLHHIVSLLFEQADLFLTAQGRISLLPREPGEKKPIAPSSAAPASITPEAQKSKLMWAA